MPITLLASLAFVALRFDALSELARAAAERKVAELERALKVAQKKSEKAMEARMRLAPGSTRARVTTANANWARAAEHRDHVSDQLDAARARLAAKQAGAQ